MRESVQPGWSRISTGFFAILLLASCGGRSDLTNSLAPANATLPSVLSAGSSLSGERFSSSKATSSCNASGGTFEVSGKAGGPFPGTFTAHGRMSEALIFHEKFAIRSGSSTITGSAESQASATPTGGCSNSGVLSFDFPILHYRGHDGAGTGYAVLQGTKFLQAFH